VAKVTLYILSLIFLAGCNSFQTRQDIIQVSCPVPPSIPRPQLETDALKIGDDSGTVIQAHRITIKRLQSWGLEQEAILKGYQK